LTRVRCAVARYTWPAVAALCLVVAPSARAQEHEPVSLTWSAPAACPTEDHVRAEVLRLLAGPPISPDRHVTAMARVMRLESGRWRVEVFVMAQGVRSLEAESCSGLADATALIVAIAVDPDRAGAAAYAAAPTALPPVQPEPALAVPPPAAPPAPLASSARLAPARGAAAEPRWSFGTWGLVDSATLPAPAFGGAFGVGALVGRLRSEAAFSVVPGRTYLVSSQPGVGADMSLWVASANVAYRVALGPAEVALGGGAEASHLGAVGVQVTAPVAGVPGSATWAALRADAMLTARIVAPIFFRLEVDAVAPLRRPTFVVDPLGTVHQPAPLTGRLGAGVELHF
jgi:hypothetical protein